MDPREDTTTGPMAAAGAPATTVTAAVRGMHCAACVGKVERALAGVPGVREALVNLATEQATVAFDPARADFAALERAVAAAGYELAAAAPAHWTMAPIIIPAATVRATNGAWSASACRGRFSMPSAMRRRKPASLK